MLASAFDTLTKLIQSPPGQLAAGGVLAGIVWKFFERVEAVLTDQAKFEIAVWLVGVRVGQKVEPWPDTFAKVFDRVELFALSVDPNNTYPPYGAAPDGQRFLVRAALQQSEPLTLIVNWPALLKKPVG
jgi:hypothetical protein